MKSFQRENWGNSVSRKSERWRGKFVDFDEGDAFLPRRRDDDDDGEIDDNDVDESYDVFSRTSEMPMTTWEKILFNDRFSDDDEDDENNINNEDDDEIDDDGYDDFKK